MPPKASSLMELRRLAFLLALLQAGALGALQQDLATALGKGACQQPTSDSVLLQAVAVKSRRDLAVALQRDADPPAAASKAAWFASPYGACQERCGAATQTRSVECHGVFSGERRDARDCANKPKPGLQRKCSCKVMPCTSVDVKCDLGVDNVGVHTSTTAQESIPSPPRFEAVGCLVDSGSETSHWTTSEGQEANNTVDEDDPNATDVSGEWDNACIKWVADRPCHGGLPFYRMQSNAMTPDLCSQFCLSKGLDLAGVSGGQECRCGASALNSAVWRNHTPRGGLLIQPESLVPEGEAASCVMRVQRFVGPYEDGGIPFGLTRASARDISYVDSIVAGHDISEETEEDGVPAESAKRQPQGPPAGESLGASAESAAGETPPGWARSCWPNSCGPAGGPWPERRGAPSEGLEDRWADYAVVRYFFDYEVDDARKEAFREAAAQIRSVTCVDFVEEADLCPPPALQVGIYDEKSCYASDIGFPGNQSYQLINMGWCSSTRYVGNIVHELGHVLGMNHEQKRPDATQNYHGHGPFLVVHWEHVPEDWRDQYHEDPASYVGSTNDGDGDPHTGYAPYDFESIMHYPANDHFDTVPADARALTGQRHQLSAGDVDQLLDAYQCRTKGHPLPAADMMGAAEVVAEQADEFQVVRQHLPGTSGGAQQTTA